MVRVVCTAFQRPRSRHSSGESPYTVNENIARRAAENLAAATGLESGAFDSDAETSSDVYWDSDGGTGGDGGVSDSGIEVGKNTENVLKRRKDRRRERNKLSAQAYRQRRKEQALSQSKILTELQDHRKGLLDKIKLLEIEKKQVETFLRSCFTTPETSSPSTSTTSTSATSTSTESYDNTRHCNNMNENIDNNGNCENNNNVCDDDTCNPESRPNNFTTF